MGGKCLVQEESEKSIFISVSSFLCRVLDEALVLEKLAPVAAILTVLNAGFNFS